MKFKYSALGPNQEPVSGLLEALTLKAVQAELHKMGFSIISINEISEAEFSKLQAEEKKRKAAAGIITFAFKGLDGAGKETEGTIDAKEAYEAYRRLYKEYQFKIKSLFPIGASAGEQTAMQDQLKQFEIQLQGETQTEEPNTIEKTTAELEAAETQINAEVVAQIDKVIAGTKEVLAANRDIFTNSRLSEIEATLGELERVRLSNNIKHISEVSHRLYDLTSQPDNIAKEKLPEKKAFTKYLGQFRESKVLKKEFLLYQKATEVSVLKSLVNGILKRLSKLKTIQIKKPGATPLKPKRVSKEEAFEDDSVSKQTFSFWGELDNFLGWLLAFYILYFFIVDFSLEKEIGLPKEFIARTLQGPLILNISLFLLFAHFTLRIRNLHFRGNIIGSLFLLFFGMGLYSLLVINF